MEVELDFWKKSDPKEIKTSDSDGPNQAIPGNEESLVFLPPGIFKRLTDRIRKAVVVEHIEQKIAIAAVAATLATIALSPYLTQQTYNYSLGEYTRDSIRAPYEMSVEDPIATERKRELAHDGVLPVFDYNSDVLIDIEEKISRAFGQMRVYFQKEAALVSEKLNLSESIAALDREAGKPDEKDDTQASPPDEESNTAVETEIASLRERIEAIETELESERAGLPMTVAEVQRHFMETLGIGLTDDDFLLLFDLRYSKQTEEFNRSLIATAYREKVTADMTKIKEVLADSASKRFVIRDLQSGGEVIVQERTGILGLADRDDAIARALQDTPPDFSADQRSLLARIAGELMRPDLVYNSVETERRVAQAVDAVIPVVMNFQKDQLIIGEGQPITSEVILVLDQIHFARFYTGYQWILIGTAFFLFLVFLISLMMAEPGGRPKDFLFFATILISSLLIFRFYLFFGASLVERFSEAPSRLLYHLFPIATGAILVRLVRSYATTMLYAMLIGLLSGWLWEGNLPFAAYVFLSCTVAGYASSRSRRRVEILVAGLHTGLANAAMLLCITMIGGDPLSMHALTLAASGFVGGILSGPVAIASLPLFEWLFGYTTNISLLELASFDSPLLRQIMIRAPGTFNHSIATGTLAESAAESIGANTVLVRVGALYHDVGKLVRPKYFVENQTPGDDPHQLCSPEESASIIQDHVTEGVKLARRYGLNREVIHFIEQHHGKSLIKYFYHLARQSEAGEDAEVKEDVFRYAGPRPRTKETGIIMLADSVEAISRTLKDQSEERIAAMVRKTTLRLQNDGELSRCPLTLADLKEIQAAFVRVLSGFYHYRIQYPKAWQRFTTVPRRSRHEVVSPPRESRAPHS